MAGKGKNASKYAGGKIGMLNPPKKGFVRYWDERMNNLTGGFKVLVPGVGKDGNYLKENN